ncbi:MAG: hypothetical protein WCF94_02770 [bacterium]|jgi:hypothetical protein
MTTKNESKNKQFSEEEIKNICELGDVLRRIDACLIKEGVIKVVNGKRVFPSIKEEKKGR